MKLRKAVALVSCLLFIITGCAKEVPADHKNIERSLELNKTYHLDLDQDNKKDTFRVTHDNEKTVLSINGKQAKYLYPYNDVSAQLLRISEGSYLVALTLKNGEYSGVTDIYRLYDSGLNRAICTSNYQIGSGYFNTIKVSGNSIHVTMYIKDTHLDEILVPMTYQYDGKSFKRKSKSSAITYVTNPQHTIHTASANLYASKGIPDNKKNSDEADTSNDEAFVVKKGQNVTILGVYFTNNELYYEATLDGKKRGYIRCETALAPYFTDIHITA